MFFCFWVIFAHLGQFLACFFLIFLFSFLVFVPLGWFFLFWRSFRSLLLFYFLALFVFCAARVIFDAFLRIFSDFCEFLRFFFWFSLFFVSFLKKSVSFLLQMLSFRKKIFSSSLIFPRADGFFLFFFAFLALMVFPCFFLFSFSRFRGFSLVFSAFDRCLLVCFLFFLLFENARSRFSSLFVLYALRAGFVRPGVLLFSCFPVALRTAFSFYALFFFSFNSSFSFLLIK